MFKRLNICYAGESFLVEGDYQPLEPETGPTYACGGTPEVPESFALTGLMIEGTDANGLPAVFNLSNLFEEDAFSSDFIQGLEAATLERIDELG